MNRAQEAFHIFRKDVRAHWSEVASILLLNVLLVILSISTWNDVALSSMVDSSSMPRASARIVVVGLLILSWCLLIGRVILADAPAGSRQFWLTRPFSRMSLLLAKAAYILLVVHLMTAAAQIIILAASGVPFLVRDLIENQASIAAAITLPMALIASLTASLGRYVFATLLVTGLAAGLLLVHGLSAEYALFYDNREFFDIAYWQVNWPRAIVCLVAAASLSVLGLVWQYRRRETIRVAAVCFVGALLVACLVMLAPNGVVSSAQTWLLGKPETLPVVSVRATPENYRFREAFLRADNEVRLPFEISGVDATNLGLANETVAIRMRSGIAARFEAQVLSTLNDLWIGFDVPIDLYRRIESEPVSISVSFDIVQFRETVRDEIPLDGRPVIIDSREQCGQGAFSILVCRTGFRGRDIWRINSRNRVRFAHLHRQSGSVSFAFNPISVYQANLSNGRIADSIPAVVSEPAGYFRGGFEIELARLADWRDVPDRRDDR